MDNLLPFKTLDICTTTDENKLLICTTVPNPSHFRKAYVSQILSATCIKLYKKKGKHETRNFYIYTNVQPQHYKTVGTMKPNHIINEVYCIKSELKVVFTSGTLHRNITLKSKLNWSSMVTFL